MPKRFPRTLAAVAAASLPLAFFLAACSATPPQTETTPTLTPTLVTPPTQTTAPVSIAKAKAAERQEMYAAAVAAFPFEMPSGYTFPEAVPDTDFWIPVVTGMTGEKAAYLWWRCAVTQSARAAFDLQEYEAANVLLAQIALVSDEVLSDNSQWVAEPVDPAEPGHVFPLAGPSGNCYFWSPGSFT